MRAATLGLSLLLLSGCVPNAHLLRKDWNGQTLPLVPSPRLQLVMPGKALGRPVIVALDISRPLSVISRECFGDTAPESLGTARVPEPSGRISEWSLVRVPGLLISFVYLGERHLGLTDERGCSVTLGADVLAQYALTVDPLRRTVSFAPSRPRADYLAGGAALGAEPFEEVFVLELSRDPKGDWPLVAARVTQGPVQLTGPFVLSTRETSSVLALEPARAQGLRPMEAAGTPPRRFAVNAVELDENVGVRPVVLQASAGWSHSGNLGRLALDVLGRFRTTIDVQGDTLVLRRPRVLTSGSQQRCAHAGPEAPNEESCFAYHVFPVRLGLAAVTAAAYRDLPKGAQIYFDVLDDKGELLPGRCQVGFSFGPTTRGITLQHLLPWPELETSLGQCFLDLTFVDGFRFSFFSEEPLPECQGTCVFVHEAESGRTSCSCPEPAIGPWNAEFQMGKDSKESAPPLRIQEPEDPR